MLRRIHIQTDDLRCLGLEVGIVGCFVPLNSVRLQTVLLPSASHHHVMDSQLLRKSTRAPMGRAVGRFSLCPRKNPRLHLRSERLSWTPLVTCVQTCQTFLQESALPLADKRRRAVYPLLNLRVARTVGQHEQHASNPCVVSPTAPAAGSLTKLCTFRSTQYKLSSLLHERDFITNRLSVTVH